MAELKGKSERQGTLPLPCPIMTLEDPWNIFPFFVSHFKNRKNYCRNHIFFFALIPANISSSNLEYFYVIHANILLYIVLFILLGHHKGSTIKFTHIFIYI